MLGKNQTSSANHQHFSNLLMIYPLQLVNVEQPGSKDVLRRSFDRARSTTVPGRRQAMVQAHAGPIRIFPSLPGVWKDIEFHDLLAEGSFLVPAKRQDGKTTWVRIRSLAGELCRVRPGMETDITIKGERPHEFRLVAPGIHEIDLNKGKEVLLLPSRHQSPEPSSPRQP